ncbi:putative phosphoribosyl transferase [Calidithermus terrae]|uniref:Putative phosphoribosyl transferase n=1 Tax=Calidithermus terrae TaxID=1408545 RepID=A0A399E8N8_9DEIN|nr:phosphoribosyltransferase [Calidithermus terrae]RIH81094.1 putative phosphoribosyl transferase [Calidithermus terrae]
MRRERFADRHEAGRELAGALSRYARRPDVWVLGLPRGGVPVAYEVAHALGVPLDVLIVRKLGAPRHEELAVGAIGPGGVRVLNRELVRHLGVGPEELEPIERKERAELERRQQAYRGARPFPDLAGKTVILVDDGLATGATMRAAALAVRAMRPARVVVAVPVAPPDTCEALLEVADEVVVLLQPEPFQAVGLWYEHFPQTSDEEVQDLLRRYGKG